MGKMRKSRDGGRKKFGGQKILMMWRVQCTQGQLVAGKEGTNKEKRRKWKERAK